MELNQMIEQVCNHGTLKTLLNQLRQHQLALVSGNEHLEYNFITDTKCQSRWDKAVEQYVRQI